MRAFRIFVFLIHCNYCETTPVPFHQYVILQSTNICVLVAAYNLSLCFFCLQKCSKMFFIHAENITLATISAGRGGNIETLFSAHQIVQSFGWRYIDNFKILKIFGASIKSNQTLHLLGFWSHILQRWGDHSWPGSSTAFAPGNW